MQQRGIFETVRVVAGRARWLDRHQARLECAWGAWFEGTAPRLSGSVPTSRDGLVRAAFAGPREAPQRIVEWRRAPRAPAPLRVALAARARSGAPGDWSHKSLDRRWVEECWRAEADETLVWSAGDGPLEGTRSNVFVWDGACLSTPPVSAGIVPGVVRGVLLDRAAARGLQVVERRLEMGELRECRALFLSGSGVGFARVDRLDDRELPEDDGDEIERAVREALEAGVTGGAR